MKKLLFFYILCFAVPLLAQPTGLHGLGDCYRNLYKQGEGFLNQDKPNYPEAFKRFIVARNCDDKPIINDLDARIDETSRKWFTELNEKRINAEIARIEAEGERKKAEEAKKRAQDAEALAKERSIFIEALLNTFHAQDFLEKDRNLDALKYSFCAYKSIKNYNDTIQDGDTIRNKIPLLPNIFQTFAQAVHQYYLSYQNAGQRDIALFKLAKTEDRFLTIGRDHTLRIWEISQSQSIDSILLQPKLVIELVDSIQNKADYILSANFSDDGKQIIYGTKDHAAYIWKGTGQPKVELQGHTGAVTQAFFLKNNDGVTIGRDGYLRKWDNSTGAEKYKGVYFGDEIIPLEVITNKEQTKFFVRTANKVFLVNEATGKYVSAINHGGQYIYAISLSPDEKHVLTASADKSVQFWDLEGNKVSSFSTIMNKSQVVTAHFHPKLSKKILITGSDHLRFLGYNGLEIQKAIPNSSSAYVKKILFTSDYNHGVALNSDGTANIFGPKEASLQTKGTVNSISFGTYENQLKQYLLTSSSLIKRDNNYTAEDGVTQVWNLDGDLLMDLILGSPVIGASFINNGKNILSITKQGDMYLTPNADYIIQQLEQEPHNLGDCDEIKTEIKN